jgi:hypothetical protein
MEGSVAAAIVDGLDERRSLQEHPRTLIAFMIASCDLLAASTPPVALQSLEVARRHYLGTASDGERDNSRIECWQYLREIGASTAIDEPHVCATRAVICILSVAQETDLFELAQWFILLTQKVADVDREQSTLLQKLFRLHRASES